MRGQRHAPAALCPRERPGTHCTGGWMGLRAGLDWCGKSLPTGIRFPDLPPRRQSLYRLRYPAYCLPDFTASNARRRMPSTSDPTHKERCTYSTRHSIPQAVTRLPFTADVRFLSNTCPCGICGGQSDIGTRSSPSIIVFLCQRHSTCTPFSFIRLSSTLYYPNK